MSNLSFASSLKSGGKEASKGSDETREEADQEPVQQEPGVDDIDAKNLKKMWYKKLKKLNIVTLECVFYVFRSPYSVSQSFFVTNFGFTFFSGTLRVS